MSDWYGSVPSHWHRARVKSVAERVTDGAHISPETENGLHDFVSTRDVKGGRINFAGSLKTSQETYDYMVNTGCQPNLGDVLFSKDGTVGETAVVTEQRDFVVASSLVIITPRPSVMVPSYLAHVFASRPAQEQAASFMRGAGLPRLSVGNLARLELLVPPIEEQRAIADYLDRETAHIDTLIEEQQCLIELLRERRNAVVDRALSHGLDAELVQTGDPWLPVLPVGWTAVATKRLLSFGPSNGVSPEAGSVGDLRTLSLGAVRDGRVSLGPDVTKFVDRAAVPRLNDLRLRAGDILLVRGNGNVNLVGRAGLVGPEFDDEEYIYPDLLIRLRVGASMLPEFFVWAFNSAATRAQIGTRARTAVGTYKVAASDVRAIVLPLPPLSEQARIVAYLDEQTAKIDSLIAETEKFIELVRERRAALITAAVTGQIGVREVA